MRLVPKLTSQLHPTPYTSQQREWLTGRARAPRSLPAGSQRCPRMNSASRHALPPQAVASKCAAPASTTSRMSTCPFRATRWWSFSGVSDSGKSSLAFGTLYAEAQRRYFESVAPDAKHSGDTEICHDSLLLMQPPTPWRPGQFPVGSHPPQRYRFLRYGSRQSHMSLSPVIRKIYQG